MKYSELIASKFDVFGKKPRGNQLEIINDVLIQFFDEDKRNVVLNAPTGIGKSILGMVISECVGELLDVDYKAHNAIISMGNNLLSRQYAESFEDSGAHKVFQIKGASNYPCAFMEAQPSADSATGEDCCKGMLHEMEVSKYCGGCEFDAAKKQVNKTDNLITNFAYFLVSQLSSGHLEPRKLHIFDEAHTFNDAYTSYTEITITIDLLSRYIKELESVDGRCNDEAAGLAVLKKRIELKELHESNYMETIALLKEIYKSASRTLNSQASLLKAHDIVKANKYLKMSGKYENLADRIKHLIEGEYEHVFDMDTPNSISIKTIFVSDSIDACLGPKNLFMSATITESIAFEIIGLDRDNTAFMMLDPVFPAENKPVLFLGKEALNYTTLKDPEVIGRMKDMVAKIVEHHKSEKGILIAPSFYLGSTLVKNVKGVKLFEHVSGGPKIGELIREFKDYKGAALLVSPSIWEGVDLPEADYCIIGKCPFGNLADKRTKYICDNYPTVYQETSLLKILQGIGRGVRSPTDKAVTYMLDKAIERLFNSKSNIWKNHYKVISKGN